MQLFYRWGQLLGLPLLWAASVYAAMLLQNLTLASQHTICGVWGCGPTTGALLVIHAGWLAVLAPPLWFLPLRCGMSSRRMGRLGWGLSLIGLLGMSSIVAWQWFVWLPQAGASLRPFIWQRSGFSIFTAVDWPLMQLFVVGLVLQAISRLWKTPSAEAASGEASPGAGVSDQTLATELLP